MAQAKQVIGGPLEIGGRVLSLSRAIRAGDFVYLTGQIPMQDGVPMTTGSVEEQTRAILDDIKATLAVAQRAYREHGVQAQVVEFIDDIPQALAQANLVVCRAGALTVAELAAAGVASVLIPLPHAVDDHQTGNARYLSEADAAVLLPQNTLNAQTLATWLQDLFGDPQRLTNMAQRAHAQAMPQATNEVVTHCLWAAGRREARS